MSDRLLFIFGAPGAGKGVSAQILKEKYGYKHLSMGEHLRHKLFIKDKEIQKYKTAIEGGKRLVPDDVVNQEFIDFCNTNKFSDCIIDGYPRTFAQLNFLIEFLSNYKGRVYFFLLEASEKLLEQRLLSRQTCLTCSHDYIFESVVNDGICNLCGGKLYKRLTDNEKMIRQRIVLFNNTTMKVIETLKKKREVCVIDANMDIHDIYEEILNVVNK